MTTCLKCNYTRGVYDTVRQSECPKCGAIYAKVEAAVAQGKPVHRVRPSGLGAADESNMLAPHLRITDDGAPARRLEAFAGSIPLPFLQVFGKLTLVALLLFGGFYAVNAVKENRKSPLQRAIEEDAKNPVLINQRKQVEADRARRREVAAAEYAKPEQVAKRAAISAQVDRELDGLAKLRQSMKDPEAFVIRQFKSAPDGSVCYEYRAKNSFGATFPGRAIRTRDGGLLLQEHLGESFVATWNGTC